MSDEQHPWDAAFPEDDDPMLPVRAAIAMPRNQLAEMAHAQRGTILGDIAESLLGATGFARGELAVLPGARVTGKSGFEAALKRNRARSGATTTPVRRLDARQRELLSHMVVKDNLAIFALDHHVDDWASLKKVMTTLGGTWKRGRVCNGDNQKGGFLFPPDVDGAEVVRLAQTSGEIFDPKLVGFFPTPDTLADDVARIIDIPRGARVLEPSAGRGALALAVLRANATVTMHCYELLADNVTHLRTLRGVDHVDQCDFLSASPDRTFDFVAMNPPFAGGADVAHVTHALKFVVTGGALVAIMSAGVVFRQDRAHTAFRALVDEHGGRFDENPEGAFLESGTGVRTVTLVIERVRA